jgi:Nitrile hydratase, alpha chain
MVARAWVDPAFKARLLKDGKKAARQRADQLMLRRLKYFLVVTGRLSLHIYPFVGASFQLLNGTREKTGTIWAMSDSVASRWGGLPITEPAK